MSSTNSAVSHTDLLFCIYVNVCVCVYLSTTDTVNIYICVVFYFKVLFIRVPYYIGDLKRDPNLENYPYVDTAQRAQYPLIVRNIA